MKYYEILKIFLIRYFTTTSLNIFTDKERNASELKVGKRALISKDKKKIPYKKEKH